MEIREEFAKLDTDNSGFITRGECLVTFIINLRFRNIHSPKK
jgi:Ca2+-binding EF-hand superfamily protein